MDNTSETIPTHEKVVRDDFGNRQANIVIVTFDSLLYKKIYFINEKKKTSFDQSTLVDLGHYHS